MLKLAWQRNWLVENWANSNLSTRKQSLQGGKTNAGKKLRQLLHSFSQYKKILILKGRHNELKWTGSIMNVDFLFQELLKKSL